MKNPKFLVVLLSAITLQSCFKADGDPLPTSGENSFIALVNGFPFLAEDVFKFTSTYYGITAYENDKTWELTFRNSSRGDIHIYLYKVTEPGNYIVGKADGDLVYFSDSDDESSVSISDETGSAFGVAYFSNSPQNNEIIEITKIQGDSIIVGEFDRITLSSPGNPNDKTILSQGKFNINLSTLNKEEFSQ